MGLVVRGLKGTSGVVEGIGGGVNDGVGGRYAFVSGTGGGVNGGGVDGRLGGLYGSMGGTAAEFWTGVSVLAKDGVIGWGSNVGVVVGEVVVTGGSGKIGAEGGVTAGGE